MSDYYLLQNQLKDGCKLTLPEGLNELMSDISREVLRSQPDNIHKFIADYLSALLVTREHLTIAARLHQDTCTLACHQRLVDELVTLGVDQPHVVAEIIVAELERGAEKDFLKRILSKTSVPDSQLPALRDVLVHAFVGHKMKSKNLDLDEDTSSSSLDTVSRAVKRTMHVYQQTSPTAAETRDMDQRVTAAYRAYHGLRGTQASDSEDRWADDSSVSRSRESNPQSSESYSQVEHLYMNGDGKINPKVVSSSSTSFIPLAPNGTKSQFYCTVNSAPEVLDLALGSLGKPSSSPEPLLRTGNPSTSANNNEYIPESLDDVPQYHLQRPTIVIGYPSDDDVSRSRLDYEVSVHENIGQSDNYIKIEPENTKMEKLP